MFQLLTHNNTDFHYCMFVHPKYIIIIIIVELSCKAYNIIVIFTCIITSRHKKTKLHGDSSWAILYIDTRELITLRHKCIPFVELYTELYEYSCYTCRVSVLRAVFYRDDHYLPTTRSTVTGQEYSNQYYACAQRLRDPLYLCVSFHIRIIPSSWQSYH